MRIIRTSLPWLLLLSFTCIRAGAQNASPQTELFAEGGGSFITNITNLPVPCPACTSTFCPPCPTSRSFSNAGRLFAGTRLRMGHNAIEASYSFSPNQGEGYNRLNVISFNYVRYISLSSKVQPFATIGLGANRFSGPSNISTGFDFAWNYGGGADIVLQRHLALRFDLRDYVGGQPSGVRGTLHNIVPSAGIVFKFR